MDKALTCLDTFFQAFGAIVSPHKTYFWLIRVDSAPTGIPEAWSFIRPGVIVRYLGILFGIGLSLVSMWD